MSEKTINTLLELLEVYRIEVPIVQRDYAHGRQDEHSQMVRFNLLKDMKSAILGQSAPLNLNFVYGKAENDKFVPLDGQQRLTTLFLLYLYAFYNDDSKTELLCKFTYETRKSSRDFLEKLIENRAAVFASDLSPSQEIEDTEWFVSAWKYDPTIQSVLTMLDDIKINFCDVENIPGRLLDQEHKPIVFNFLEMKNLGMEDSLYIKLNARGKPLTSFENFKAQLIGRLKKIHIDFSDDFEKSFDLEWTDLFWSNSKEKFDMTFLTFFGVLLMNKEIIVTDTNWSDTFNYEKVDEEIFETAFHTLNFLSGKNHKEMEYQLVFNSLKEKPTYPGRVLFHAFTTYLYKAKGRDNGSLTAWIRIIKNLTLNSQIDTPALYRRAIEGINKLADKWDSLTEYFSQSGNVTGFSQEQIGEEQTKAQLILQSPDFAKVIHEAEQHPYFSGQIRSALHYSKDSDRKCNIDAFMKYWDKIAALFDETKPKHGHLLRQALLTFGDYTLPVGSYKTLCVDDPNEASSTPSLKRLFSNHGNIVKQLLEALNINHDIAPQLERIVANSSIPKNDWRYCFIKFPALFTWMSASHLRLREVNGEWVMIPNKSSNGFNFELFLAALNELLEERGLQSYFDGENGFWGDRYLSVKEFNVGFENEKFLIYDQKDTILFETKTDDPIAEVASYLGDKVAVV